LLVIFILLPMPPLPAGSVTATALFLLLSKKYASHFFESTFGAPNQKRRLTQLLVKTGRWAYVNWYYFYLLESIHQVLECHYGLIKMALRNLWNGA